MRKDLAEGIQRVERIKKDIHRWYNIEQNYNRYMAVQKYSLFLFLYHQGVRIGEALNLEWKDLDLEGDPPTARIQQLKKRKETYRIIPLADEVVKILREYKRMSGDGKVWPFTQRAYRAWLKRNYGINPHLLRHACAVRLLKKTGGNLEVVRRLLGHSGYSVLKQYLDLSIVDLHEVINGG